MLVYLITNFSYGFLSLLDEKFFKSSKLSKVEHLLLVLMKFKLGLLHADLSIRFGLELCYVSKIYSKWVKALSRAMKFLIIGQTDKP